MTDRPIIFSASMVRALLAGRKTQTRRLATSPLRRVEVGDRLWVRESYSATFWTPDDIDGPARELWATPKIERTKDLCADRFFRVDEETKPHLVRFVPEDQWTPSIHMPRWASRLTLIVDCVRVEPLQAISEADAMAEGVERGKHPITGEVGGWQDYSIHHAGPHKGKRHPHAIAPWKSAALSFQSLWETLHGKESWQTNPGVVALTFRVINSNIDRIGA